MINQPLGIRRSALAEAEKIAHELIAAQIPTIIFTRSRLNTEVLVTYLRQSFHKLGDMVEKIRGYRGGYLPTQRRQIERDLRDGKVLGVVSTNALELGIDIGTLQAVVLTGYPGTIASTWQQIGASRSTQESLAVMVVIRARLISLWCRTLNTSWKRVPSTPASILTIYHILVSQHKMCSL